MLRCGVGPLRRVFSVGVGWGIGLFQHGVLYFTVCFAGWSTVVAVPTSNCRSLPAIFSADTGQITLGEEYVTNVQWPMAWSPCSDSAC